MIRDKKILITGGAGFIGTHLAERLVPHNEVTLLDNEIESNTLSYSSLAEDDRVRKVHGDVRDSEVVDGEVSKCDVVLHLASILGVQKVIDNARETIDTITVGTRNVLEAAKKNKHLKRLINISSSEVYGNVMDAVEGTVAMVGTANDARLSYASAKLMGEHLVWAYHRDFGIPTVIIRPFNIYGPMRITANAVSIFVARALAGKDVPIYGDGSQLRSWCYIDDFCEGVLACIESDAASGEDFNLGNPVTATTIYDLAMRTVRLAGSQSRVTPTGSTFSDIGVRAPNSTKARKILGYSPKYDMDAGLLPTIEWHRNHLADFEHWL